MKKFLKGLRYFLCYIAITLATATGVVVYQTNNSTGNISNGNTTGSSVNQVENNLMEVVTNVMALESFNVNSNISILDTDKNPIDIAFDIDINLGAGFSSVDAEGNFDISIGENNYDIDITFVDNTFFITTFGKNVKFTTNNLIQGIGGVLNLLDVELPINEGLFENFDVTSLLGYMGEYKEVETETGYNISLEFMNYDIALKCDKEFNPQNVQIKDVLIEGFEIDLDLNLTTYENKQEFVQPNKTFLNLDTVINLLPMVQEAMDNKFVSANIFATYEEYSLQLDAKADFSQDLLIQITSPALENINFTLTNNSLYATIQNLKFKGDIDDIDTIINFIKNDLKQNVEAISPEVVEKVTQTTNDITNAINEEINSIDFDKILEYIDYLTINDNQMIISIPNIANVTINIKNNTISNIIATAYGVTIEIRDISFDKQNISLQTNDFVDFENVFPVVKTFVNTIFAKGISGTMTFTQGDKTNNLNYAIRYTNSFETSFDTTILDKTVSVVTDNSKVYLAVDGIKLNVDITEYQTILDYINTTFNQTITLPTISIPDVDIYEMIVGTISMFDYIKKINGGIEISFAGIKLQIISSEDYLQHIAFIYDNYKFDLDITGYGEVELFDINKSEYLNFEDITNYINNALSFVNNNAYETTLIARAKINNDNYAFGISADISTNGNIDGVINFVYNKFNLPLGIILTNDALNINYEGLDVYGKITAIDSIKNLLNNVVPNYINLDQLLLNNGINLDELANTKISIPQIDYSKLILALDSIAITKDTITIDIDLSKLDSNIQLIANLTISTQANGYKAVVTGYYEGYYFSAMIIINGIEDFTAVIPENAINIEDYLNFVEVLHNTIDGRNLKLDITANYNNYNINANAFVDFRDVLKLQLTSDSFGSNLDIAYTNTLNKLLVTFGDLKISGKYEDIESLLNFVQADLNNALMSYGIDALNNLNLESENFDVDINFEDIKDILYSITFNGNIVEFVKDGIIITLTVENKTVTNISFRYNDISGSIGISKNTQAININETGFIPFENILENLKAIANTVSSKAIGGKVTINFAGQTYVGNLKVNYINDVLAINVTSNMYKQDIEVNIVNNAVYVKLNELKLQVSWAERYELQDFLNTKFDLSLDFDAIFGQANDLINTNKEFALEDINIDFIKNFFANKNGLSLDISNIPLFVEIATYKDTNKKYLSSISTSIDDVEISISDMIFGEDAIIEGVNSEEYSKYTAFTRYFDEVERLINASKDETTDQYTLSGNAKIYKLDENGSALVTNGVKDEIAISINELKFDATKNTFIGGIDATGSGSLYTDYLTGYNHSFDAAYDYNFIYFDYNGLRAKFSKQSNSEFITTLKNMIPTYLGDTALTQKLVEVFDIIRFDTTGNMLFNPIKFDVTFDMVSTFVPMLSTLRLESDNSLTIGLDLSSFVASFTEELILNVSVDNNGRLALKINKFKLTKDLAIDFTIFVDTADMFTVNPTGTYMDMTSIGKLLNDFDKTAQSTTIDNEVYKLNVSGKLHVKIKVSIINIDKDIPFDAQLVIDRNSSQLVEAKIIVKMPSIPLVTDGCTTTLYLTNRLEGESILYIDRQGSDPLKSKYKTSELGANLVKLISDITAMSESTVQMFLDIDLKYIDGPTKAENVLKDYSCVTGVNSRDYTIGLDLRQITLLDMMKGYSESNATSVVIHAKDNKFNSIDVQNITLEAISGVYIYGDATIDMSKVSQDFDIISEIENLDATLFGSWGDGSLVADFIENGGSNVPNKMGTTGRSFTLPVPVKEVVNGNTLEVYRFLGWSLNSNGSGELYNGTYMFGTNSLTFYAVWELATVYTQKTINFVTEYLMDNKVDVIAENNIPSITTYNGYDITNNLPTFEDIITVYYEDQGVSITYRFDGLFKTKVINNDGTISYSDKFDQTVMPDENITLYASFVEIDRVYKRKLAIYDQDKTLYEGYFIEGESIDVLSYVTYKDTTKWYDDYNADAEAKYTNEIAVENLPTVMPSGSDLTLYVRNMYTLTFTSTYGDTTTYTQTAYQGEKVSIPSQASYENIVYKEDGKTPNYLESYIYDNYYLATDSTKVVPEYIPNNNATYSAKWDYVTTSYFKVTFNVGWTKPSWWISSGSEQSSNKRDAVAEEYVLSGSTLSGTTLTKKNSAIGLVADTTVSKYSDCKYKYGINYSFETVGWSNSKVQNVYDNSYSESYTITKDTTFYAVWGHC